MTPSASSETPTAAPRSDHLIWIDLEMTGLDCNNDSILEIATLVTDNQLNVLAEGPELAIHHPVTVLDAMDDWNRNQHGKSGLWQRVLDSANTLEQAEQQTLAFLAEWVTPGASPICGNSVCQDRRFLARLMPQLDNFFHYRSVDVSTLKVLARHWAPSIAFGLTKVGAHTALSDIRESVEELRYYRRHMGPLSGL